MPFLGFRWTAFVPPCQAPTLILPWYQEVFQLTSEAHHQSARKTSTNPNLQLLSTTHSEKIWISFQNILCLLQLTWPYATTHLPGYPHSICNILVPNTFTQKHQCPYSGNKIYIWNAGLWPRFCPLQAPIQSHAWHQKNSRILFQKTPSHPHHTTPLNPTWS